MNFKIATLTVLITASTSIYAYAATPLKNVGELGISNQTSYSLSFSVNHICSNVIGNISGYSIKTVSVVKIIKSCAAGSLHNTCDITGYDRLDCQGKAVGGVKIDFANHQMEVMSNNVNNISVAGSIGSYQYNIFFNEDYGPDNNITKTAK